MPIVSTTHCDIPEVVLHGKSGLLRPSATWTRWWRTSARSPTIRSDGADMGRAARAHVEAEYNVRTQGARLADVYEELAA
jgi:colanic acid/amylovoran biosynthesis glycosyltransferase